jgi:hypothetical protein
MSLADVVAFTALIATQVFCFTLSTTGLAVHFVGRDRLPPLARRIASAYRLTGGRHQLVGALFWLILAVGVCVALFVNGSVLNSVRDVAAGVASVLLDLAWLGYLIGRRD